MSDLSPITHPTLHPLAINVLPAEPIVRVRRGISGPKVAMQSKLK